MAKNSSTPGTEEIADFITVDGIALKKRVDILEALHASAGGPTEWGQITGTLSAQADLQTALNNKQNKFTNETVLANITQANVEAWTGAVSKAHEHDNKEALDTITSARMAVWDTAVSEAYVDTQVANLQAADTTLSGRIDVNTANITTLDSKKQNKLVAGPNITLVDGPGDVTTISATGDISVAFADISGNPTDNANLTDALNAKQNVLVTESGCGIIIDSSTNKIQADYSGLNSPDSPEVAKVVVGVEQIAGHINVTRSDVSPIVGTNLTFNSATGKIDADTTTLATKEYVTDQVATRTTPDDVNSLINTKVGTLDVPSIGGAGKFIQAISESDGKISATAVTFPTDVGYFINDKGYQNATEVSTAINSAITALGPLQPKLVAGTNVTLTNVTGGQRIDVESSASVAWGGITGILASQTDLKSALDAKSDASNVYTKAESDAKFTALSYTDPDYVEGSYVTKVTQTNGKIAVAHATFPTNVGYFTNDKGYQNATEVNGLIDTKLGSYYTKTATDTLLNGKQNTLVAGDNITITGNTISATSTEYTGDSSRFIQVDSDNKIGLNDEFLTELSGLVSTVSGHTSSISTLQTSKQDVIDDVTSGATTGKFVYGISQTDGKISAIYSGAENISNWDSAPTDDEVFLRGDSSNLIRKTKFSYMWDYIKSKINSVLGINDSDKKAVTSSTAYRVEVVDALPATPADDVIYLIKDI